MYKSTAIIEKCSIFVHIKIFIGLIAMLTLFMPYCSCQNQ